MPKRGGACLEGGACLSRGEEHASLEGRSMSRWEGYA